LYCAESDRKNPFVSPFYASDDELKILPPILLQVGEIECLYDEATQFADRFSKLGLPIKLEGKENSFF
jgi:acetyl esterase